jgi:hypothetical protein
MSLTTNYIPNIPQANQQINNTQPAVLGNFQDIQDLLAINHIPFNTPNTFGRHAFVNYVEQSSDPSTLSTEMALYSKSVGSSANKAELFYRYPNNGNVVQLTGVTSTPSGGTGATSGGNFIATTSVPLGSAVFGWWQYLSNGILIMSFTVSNYVTKTTTSPYTITFPSGVIGGVNVPSFTQTPFNVQLTAQFEAIPNYSMNIINNSSGQMYYSGPFNVNSTISQIQVTLIGI